jgi:hypothetical protein
VPKQSAKNFDGMKASLDYADARSPLLATAVRGHAAALTTRRLARAFVHYPWMTLGVILRIHWQALRLWLKGVPFFSKPLPPIQETTR